MEARSSFAEGNEPASGNDKVEGGTSPFQVVGDLFALEEEKLAFQDMFECRIKNLVEF